MRKLKVYGHGNGTSRRIVAAKSQQEAARLVDTSLGSFRAYGGVTWNHEENELALSEPGVVWEKKYQGHATWERLA